MNIRPFASLPRRLQDVPAAQAKFCLDVRRFIASELCLDLQGSRILVALSGGADSTALLLNLHYLAPGSGFTLFAAHLDHGLRPSSADEAAWCVGLCETLGIACLSERRNIRLPGKENTTGLEEQARSERYAFLRSAAEYFNCTSIAAGHTLNDLAEDVLMRLIRGSGWPGLGGMAAVDPERRLVRPLLACSRLSIENFLNGIGMSWLEDESNADQTFFRNRVRHSLLPAILGENPSFLDRALGLWQLARIDQQFFDDALADAGAAAASPGDSGSLTITSDSLAVLSKSLRLRLYMRAVAALGPGQSQLKNLLSLDETWLSMRDGNASRGSRRVQFPGEKVAIVNKNGITWQKPERGGTSE